MADGATHSGESVAEVRSYRDRHPEFAQLSGGVIGRSYVKGQGTVIALGKGRFLVALMSGTKDGSSGSDDAQRSRSAERRTWNAIPVFLLRRVYGQPDNVPIGPWPPFQGPRAIGADDLPDLVVISRANDRSSVIRVTPDNLSSALGGDARIVSAQIEVTTDPITRGISKTFPWLRESDPSFEVHYGGVVSPPSISDFRSGVS